MKTLSVKTLPELDQKRIEEITNKSVEELTPEDEAYLRARSMYLNGDQREAFAEVLHTKGEKVENAVDLSEVPDDLSEMKYKDLQKLAAKLGLTSVGVSHEELIANVTAELQSRTGFNGQEDPTK